MTVNLECNSSVFRRLDQPNLRGKSRIFAVQLEMKNRRRVRVESLFKRLAANLDGSAGVIFINQHRSPAGLSGNGLERRHIDGVPVRIVQSRVAPRRLVVVVVVRPVCYNQIQVRRLIELNVHRLGGRLDVHNAGFNRLETGGILTSDDACNRQNKRKGKQNVSVEHVSYNIKVEVGK